MRYPRENGCSQAPSTAFEAENGFDFSVREITDFGDAPETRLGAIPWCDPDLQSTYDDSTCENIILHAALQQARERRWLQRDMLWTASDLVGN